MKRFCTWALLFLAGCQLQHARMPERVQHSLDRLGGENRQAIVVSACPHQPLSVVAIRLFERDGHGWNEIGKAMDGVAGRNGLAPFGEKREGDGRTPSGVFPLERGFGYAPLETKIPYIILKPEMAWIDDPASPRYNMLSTREEASGFSHEIMRRNDELYRYGIVIEYNTKTIVPGAGSAIFFHVWNGPGSSTAGCVAAPAGDIIRILRWLDPSKKPVAIIQP